MSKPIFYINLHDDGTIRQITAKHPTDPPKHGGVWQTYVPGNAGMDSDLTDAIMPTPTAPENPKQLQGDFKVPLHLVPPGLEIYAAMALGEGGLWKAVPYGPYNFRESRVEAMTYVGAIMRHIKDYIDGYDIDPDSPVNKPSLAGVAGSLAILIDATENGNLIDNRPNKGNARAMMNRFESDIRAMKDNPDA